MTKRAHAAHGARVVTGAATGFALVGIVTGFQISAQAQPNEVVADPAQTQQGVSGTHAVAPVAPEAVPAPVEQAPAASLEQAPAVSAVSPASAPVEAVPAPAPAVEQAPAPVVPAAPVAPSTPVDATTAGS